MKFKVGERLLVLSILPVQGNLANLRILRDLRMKLSFTEEEHERLKISQQGNFTTWDVGADGDGVEIEIGKKAEEIIKRALEDADAKGILTDGHIEVYERFFPPAAEKE